MMKFHRVLLTFPFLAMLIGCASLPKLDTDAPKHVDFSGQWVLNEELSQAVVFEPGRGGSRPKGMPKGGGRGEPSKGGGVSGAGRTHGVDSFMFMRKAPTLIAKELRIEQGEAGMGIAFPKHTYRDIDWGETKTPQGSVIAGWNTDSQLVVITKGERRSYTETFSLSESGKMLTLTIELQGRRGERTFTRVFDLMPPKE